MNQFNLTEISKGSVSPFSTQAYAEAHSPRNIRRSINFRCQRYSPLPFPELKAKPIPVFHSHPDLCRC